MASYQPPDDMQQWMDWMAAGLHGRNRWRFSWIVLGIVFARGRRTVTAWLRAVGVSDDFADYYYFLAPLGRKSKQLAERLLVLLLVHVVGDESKVLLAVDDTPTKRYGPKVEGAGIHHNPTPGPADQEYLYGHIWVTVSLVMRHDAWGTIGLPLLGMLYVRLCDVARIPAKRGWRFRTKLELAIDALRRLVPWAVAAKKRVWVVADGAYAKLPFLRPLRRMGVTVVSRLRKDAALWTVPPQVNTRRRGRPRKYGAQRIHLNRRGAHPGGWQSIECCVYGRVVVKQVKTFLATYRPADGLIRVALVRELHGVQHFFCTNVAATPREIIEAFADRASIEQDFHDVKEVWGAGQQQVRNIWTNVAVFNLNLWVHTLVECWAWHKPAEAIRDREASPWDDADRRPSHADRRKALCRLMLHNQFLSLPARHRRSSKIRALYETLLQLAA